MMRAILIKLPIVFYYSIFVRLNSDLLFVGGVHDNNRSWWYPSIGTLCLLCAVGCLLSNECWLSIFYFGWINDWDCHYLNGKKNMSSAWIWIVNNTDNQRAKAMELASILFNCPEHFFIFGSTYQPTLLYIHRKILPSGCAATATEDTIVLPQYCWHNQQRCPLIEISEPCSL